MTSPHHPTDFLHDLRVRSAAEGGVFWIDDERLAVFEPEAARRISGANWRDLVMPDRFVDLLRRRRSTPVPWTRVRTAWLTQLRALTTGEHNATMAARMERIIDERVAADRTGAGLDLVLLAQDLAIRTLRPVALAGLTPRETARIDQDLHQKLTRLIDRHPGSGPLHHAHFAAVQLRAGLVVRRVLRDRASGRRARELDLADPAVDMLPALGMDRAVDMVTTVLTAIGGPPGSAAASVLYALARYPEWERRLAAELAGVPRDAFFAAPTRTAPVTAGFVKEVLRMWSPPLLLMRRSRDTFEVGATRLEKGQGYVVSPHMIHRDPRIWQRPDTFDPDRFLPGATEGPARKGQYVPFGWEPKKCVGADIGTIQLMTLCHLMCVRHRLTVPHPESVVMTHRFAPVPQDFHGHLTRR